MLYRVLLLIALTTGAAAVPRGTLSPNDLDARLSVLEAKIEAMTVPDKIRDVSKKDTMCDVDVKPNGMCPGAPAEYIQQDGCCYKSRVCTLPNDICCTRSGGCSGPKRLPGSEAGVNYEGGWNKPQGCSSCCEANGQRCGPCE